MSKARHRPERSGTRRSLLLPPICMMLATGCASSPLPAPGEPSFQRGQDRLRDGLRAGKVEQVPEPEQVLFTQAEAFFHYRYRAAPSGAGTYLAEAVVAALEFGPL